MTPTPLQPREFFDGTWTGHGELRYQGLLGRLRRPEPFVFSSVGQWITDKRKEFEDRLEFESGRVLKSRFTAEILDEGRLHVTSEAMPGGADILLAESGYTYTPYMWVVGQGRFKLKLRCEDTNVVDEKGAIHDRLEMRWLGVRLASMTMTIQVDRSRARPLSRVIFRQNSRHPLSESLQQRDLTPPVS